MGSRSPAPAPTPTPKPSPTTTPTPTPSPSPSPVVTNPRNYLITVIGDSHSDYYGNARGSFGFFGQHLNELITAAGYEFSLFAASGSNPTWWFDATPVQAALWGYTQTADSPAEKTCTKNGKSGTCVPKLSPILSAKPKLFVIEQGTNLLGYSKASITQQITQMVQTVSAKAGICLWVGAPNARTDVHPRADQNQLWALIRQYASKNCYVYDSRFLPETDSKGNPILDKSGNLIMDVPLPYTPDANNDGEHLGMTAAGEWAQGVALTIEHIIQKQGN